MLGKVRSITETQAESFGCTAEIREGVPGAVLVNDAGETAKAAAIAREAFGDDAVMYPGPSYLGSEDFAFMLQEKKGTYCLLGNGDTPMVHHPQLRVQRRDSADGRRVLGHADRAVPSPQCSR